MIIEAEKKEDFNNIILKFDINKEGVIKSQIEKELLISIPEVIKEIEIEGENFKIKKVRILEFYKGETLNVQDNIRKINMEGTKNEKN